MAVLSGSAGRRRPAPPGSMIDVMTPPPNAPGRIVRVLLVDDDTELGELVREYLAREGCLLEVEADGTRAVDRALSGDFQLIVLDVMLPGVSGFDILRHLRASPSPSTRVSWWRVYGRSCAARPTTPSSIPPSPRTSGWASTMSRSTCGATSCGERAPRCALMPFDRNLDVHVSRLRKKLIKALGGGWSAD